MQAHVYSGLDQFVVLLYSKLCLLQREISDNEVCFMIWAWAENSEKKYEL